MNQYQILKKSPQLKMLAKPIKYHHDRYWGGNPSGLKRDEIPLTSQIIHIADRIEVLIDDNQTPVLINNIKEFTENLIDTYAQASNKLHAEHAKLKSKRTVKDLIS